MARKFPNREPRQTRERFSLAELRERLSATETEHSELSAKRQQYLAVLKQRDSLKKFKQLQSSLDQERALLALMKEKFKRLDEMLKLGAEIKRAIAERDASSEGIAEMVRKSSGRFSDIRIRFAKIIRDVLGRNAELYVRPNENGNLEFRAEFQEGGAEDVFTSESKGTTYKKFLCMAFDAAVAEACSKEHFFHFIYHDGALETEDNRRKVQWLETVRKIRVRIAEIAFLRLLLTMIQCSSSPLSFSFMAFGTSSCLRIR